MGLFKNDFADQFLLPAILIFLLVGSVFALVVGLGLILKSPVIFRFFEAMNRWVSTRKMQEAAEMPRSLEGGLSRQRHIVGTLLVLGAGLSLLMLAGTFDTKAIAALFQLQVNQDLVEPVVQVAKWVLFIGHAVAMAMGIALIFFPETLARIEARGNRWHTIGPQDRDLDAMHMGLDQWARTYPRAMGLCLVVFSLFVVLNLWAVLAGHR